MDTPTISRKDYISNINNLSNNNFYNSPYLYVPILITISGLLTYYYFYNITNYLAINILSGLGYGFGGSIEPSDENTSLTDFSY
jgi:hypothetical protein